MVQSLGTEGKNGNSCVYRNHTSLRQHFNVCEVFGFEFTDKQGRGRFNSGTRIDLSIMSYILRMVPEVQKHGFQHATKEPVI